MPDPKRRDPQPIERPPTPDSDHEPDRQDPSPRLIHPEDEDRKVRPGEKRPFGVMP